MGIWTLLIMLLLVFQFKCAEAQVNAIFDARNTSQAPHVASTGTNVHAMATSAPFSPRVIGVPKTGCFPLNCKNTEWSTFSLRYNNSNTGDDWLYEHNMVVVKSLVQIANRLIVGINCRYNWSFTVAGNGAGMVLNKLPIKIYFAGVMGGAPDLCHR